MLTALAAGVLTVRSDDGTVVQANPAAARILERATLVGEPIGTVMVPLLELLADGETDGAVRRERQLLLPSGRTVHLGYSATRFESDGEAHCVVMFQEISAILELRRERDRLLQMATLGDALPSILHELRNPLAAITSLLEVMTEEAGADAAADLEAVLSEVRRLNLGLQGIGSVSRSMHTERAQNVDRGVRDAVRILAVTAKRRRVELFATGADLEPLHLDGNVVNGVVFNLVKNAIEACEPGGRVDVEARVSGGEFVLAVRDTGRGMNDDVRARCTDLFYTTKEQGSGVGLALCRQVAERSGGWLEVESRLKAGTTVTVHVPLQNPLDFSPTET